MGREDAGARADALSMALRRLSFTLLAALLLAALPATARAEEVVTTVKVGGERTLEASHPDLRSDLDRVASAVEQDQAGGADAASGADSPVGYLSDTWCGNERATDDLGDAVHTTAPVVKVVYARPSDQPDRFSTYEN